MKKLITILVIGFSLNSNIYAQDISTSEPTTLEEYNYITKGYRVQKESGLDMKKGYEFRDITEAIVGSYHFSILSLVRVPKNEIAALLVITNSTNSGKTYYFCIPHDNPELEEKYLQDLNSWDFLITKAYSYLMSTELSNLTALYHETGKKIKR
jgi:hypothetical protein